MATKQDTKKGAKGAPAGAKAAPQDGGKKAKGGAGKGERRERGPHANAGRPAPAPRLKEYYTSTVRAKLMQQFDLKNPHQVPNLEKIVINCGVGEAIKQPKVLDKVVE